MGVSGLQPWTPPLHGNSFNPVVVVGGCLAVPSGCYSYPRRRRRSWLFLPGERRVGVTRLGGIVGVLKQATHDRTLLEYGVHRLSFGYCLVTRAGRPPPKVVRNPLRSDLTLPSYSSSCQLNVCIGNSGCAISGIVGSLVVGFILRLKPQGVSSILYNRSGTLLSPATRRGSRSAPPDPPRRSLFRHGSSSPYRRYSEPLSCGCDAALPPRPTIGHLISTAKTRSPHASQSIAVCHPSYSCLFGGRETISTSVSAHSGQAEGIDMALVNV